MEIKLSDHFTYKKLLRFTVPSIAMMIFTSIYGVVDGFFVSNFVGKTPFAALNYIMPFIMMLGTVGFMFGTGGSALVSKTMGENNMPKAKEYFSLFVYAPVVISAVLSGFGIIFLPQVATLMGADSEMLGYCVTYGRIILCALPFFTLQMEFQTFFVTAEKPQLGFIVTIIAGVTNMVLDALFIAVFRWGLAGAAIATAISQTIGGIIPIFYFSFKNSSLLRLTKTKYDGRAMWQATTNGFSELLNNVSMSLVGMLFNVQLMKYAGQNGVAAYGTIMYIDMLFFAAFIGYSIGTAPVISFHFGANNHKELKSLLKKSLVVMAVFGGAMCLFAEVMSRPLAMIFSSYDKELLDMTIHAFRIYSTSFLIIGIPIFASSFFTALNNGFISAAISFLRAVVFEVIAILTLPVIMGVDGLWWSIVFARVMAVFASGLFLITNQKRYKY